MRKLFLYILPLSASLLPGYIASTLISVASSLRVNYSKTAFVSLLCIISVIFINLLLGTLPLQRVWVVSLPLTVFMLTKFNAISWRDMTKYYVILIVLDMLVLRLNLFGYSSVYYTIFGTANIEQYGYSIGRYIGLLGNPNASGVFYGLGALFFIHCFYMSNILSKTIGHLLMFALCLLLQISTLSRSSIAASLVGVFSAFLYYSFTVTHGRRKSFQFILFILAITFFVYTFIQDTLFVALIERFSSAFDGSSSSSESRLDKLFIFYSQLDVITLFFGGIFLDIYDNDWLFWVGNAGLVGVTIYSSMIYKCIKGSGVVGATFIIYGLVTSFFGGAFTHVVLLVVLLITVTSALQNSRSIESRFMG